MTPLNEAAVEATAKAMYGEYFVDPPMSWEDAPEADKIMWRALAVAAIAAYETVRLQPIKTAPTDGSWFVAVDYTDGKVHDAAVYRHESGRWRCLSSGNFARADIFDQGLFTHWFLLPRPLESTDV